MKYLPLLLFAVSFPCFSQDSPKYHSCLHSSHTQVQMNACAQEDARQADIALNSVYLKLLAVAATEPDAIKKIKAAERTWIIYRDTYIEAMFPAEDKQAEYGSLYPTEASLLRAKLTRRQIEAVSELLKQYDPRGRE